MVEKQDGEDDEAISGNEACQGRERQEKGGGGRGRELTKSNKKEREQ